MARHYTRRSATVVGVILILLMALVVTAWDSGGKQVALFAATVIYSLLIVGLALGTVRLYRVGHRRTRIAMAAGLGAFAVAGVIGAITSSDGQAVVVIVQMIIGMIVVDAVVLSVQLLQRRRPRPGG